MKPRRTIWIWGLFAALMLVLLPNLLDIKWQNMLFRREAGFTRHFADSTLLPWRLVGRLTARSSICTASLIAPDLLLSAAHCVINARTLQPIAPAQIAFQPSFGGRAIYAKAVYFDRSWLYASDRTQLQFDWAVIHLQQPVGGIGQASGLEIARTIPKLPAEVSQAGYGFNRGQLYLDEACRIHRIERHQGANLFYHNCLIEPGDSGGPLLIQTRDGWQIIGINIAGTGMNGQFFHGIALATPSLLERIRTIGSRF